MTDALDEKEKRRRKQAKRMGKILARAWSIDGSEPFQEERHAVSKEGHVLDLTTIGQKIDESKYRLGRHGWEDFARDLGGVYNRHVKRKTKHTKIASKHIEDIKEMLGQKDQSLSDLAKDFVPSEAPVATKKRKASEDLMDSRIVRKKSSHKSLGDKAESGDGELTLKDREARAMDQLASFVEEKGGSREQIAGFRSRVTRKPSDRRYDVNYFNAKGRRFRSMLEVGRFLNLVKNEKPKKKAGFKKDKPKTSREKEAEKKKLRKELEKLRKAHQRATKALDDFNNDQKESRFPMEDLVLAEEERQAGKKSTITPQTCAAARIPDIHGFPGVPQHCIPDLLMAWDFLSTFHKVLHLEPIPLDDFACALTYQPPENGQMHGDDVQAPPVYLAEAHLGLLKLLVGDRQSDEWWWSILETHESEISKDPNAQVLTVEDNERMAVIKVDMEALLSEEEDPLITTSWLTSLEGIRKNNVSESDAIKKAMKTALGVVANKWVAAYLKKSLKLLKRKDVASTKRAIYWLVDRVKDARPDLYSRSVRESKMMEIRAKVVEEAKQQMEKLSSTAPTVKDEDVASDVESDEESDESDDEDMADSDQWGVTDSKVEGGKLDEKDESKAPASVIPPRPPPTLVDLLLPPLKPQPQSEFVNAFTWPQLAGATALRVLHRFKRIRNEVDDSLRSQHELPQLTVSQRRQREAVAASRIFTECCVSIEGESPSEKAVEHLCTGGDYLDLAPVQRLCVLRMLIEAAYDTDRVFEEVDGNLRARVDASKLVDKEEKRAKKEAKEKAAAAEASAREQLAADARNKFLEEKRAEIRKINEGSNEYTDEFMDSLTDEDIIEFDEDIKADFAALPAPESFNKTEVKEMVVKMQEAAAFDTHSLRVLTMEELVVQEKEELKEMESQLASLAGDDPDNVDSSIDRETTRTIERLRRNIDKAKDAAVTLPESRALACAILQDAIADGTIKVLKSALREAKHAKLTGEDEVTGGVWALNLMRDAALELENAKQHKRVADAQKDLVAKRNKCFIRTVPLGRDRFRNRFWHFDRDEHSHFWAEVAYVLNETEAKGEIPSGFLDLNANKDSLFIGAKDEEEDLAGKAPSEAFIRFSRQEYHSSGTAASLAKKNWGCHATEQSIRTLIKSLDGRGVREHELKSNLKEALEENVDSGEKHDSAKDAAVEETKTKRDVKDTGDEAHFKRAKESEREFPRDVVSMEVLDKLESGIGQKVRVRVIVDGSKDPAVVRYENGRVKSWRGRFEEVEMEDTVEIDEEAPESAKNVVEVQEWEVLTERGHRYWLSAADLMEALCRFARWFANDRSYFEFDAAFLSYRNTLGRHCGRVGEAPYASSPMVFARMMVKREQELYAKLKNRNYDNNWGKSGARAVWTNSMKDYTFDFSSAREGLLTLENAFYELMGGSPDDGMDLNGQELLDDPATRDDIELESLDNKSINGLWNSNESRAVFYAIVRNCKNTGFLALAFDLLCRNTTAYLSAHKLLEVKPEPAVRTSRSTRRMNAWQQANQEAGLFY